MKKVQNTRVNGGAYKASAEFKNDQSGFVDEECPISDGPSQEVWMGLREFFGVLLLLLWVFGTLGLILYKNNKTEDECAPFEMDMDDDSIVTERDKYADAEEIPFVMC